MFVLLALLFVGLIPTGHFEFLGGAIEVAENIDLGSSLYPMDCSDLIGNENRYYLHMGKDDASKKLYYITDDEIGEKWINATEQTAQSFTDGLAGPRLCKISGKPALGLDVSFDQIDFDQMKYLRLANYSYYMGWEDAAERHRFRTVLYESPTACFFKGGMDRRTEAFASILSLVLLLVYSYFIRTTRIFQGPSTFLSVFIHNRLDTFFERILER